MHFRMGLSRDLVVRQELLLVGGATQTIFPAAEVLLHEGEYQRALVYVAARKNMERYRSMMDFLFCEIFTLYRPVAFAYYRDEGPQLQFVITEEQRRYFEQMLVLGLQIAYGAFCEERRMSWTAFRCQVIRWCA